MTALRVDRLAEVRALSVADAAPALGLTLTRGRGLGPCPACNENTRHRKTHDKRGAIGIRPDGRGWACHQCGTTGDVVKLAALALLGKVPNDGAGWRELLDLAADRGLCSQAEGRDQVQRRVVLPRVVPSPPAPEPTYPPPGEVAALWDACQPLGRVPEVASEWAARKLDVAAIEDRDLARALPKDAPTPPWAWGPGGRWSAGDNRLLLPMHDATGSMVALHARAATVPPPAEGGRAQPKGLSPCGHSIAGAVFADRLVRLLFAGGSNAVESASELVRRVGLIVCEGGPDFLTWATHWSDADEIAPAVVGLIAGSWTQAHADKVPDGTRVLLCTHGDDAGNSYAAEVAATFSGRCELLDFDWTAP